MKEEEVSKFCAEVLLKTAGKFNLQEFLSIWQQSVPEGNSCWFFFISLSPKLLFITISFKLIIFKFFEKQILLNFSLPKS